MHEEEESDEHMPDRSEVARAASRLGVLGDLNLIVAGGEIDWPLNPVVGAAPEPNCGSRR